MLSRRIILPAIILLAGGLYLFTRNLLWPLLGGILILYHEQRLQTRLLELLLSDVRSSEDLQGSEVKGREIESVEATETAEPEPSSEETTPVGPGYTLTEPDFVTSRWNESPPSEEPPQN